jgi:hypothetical protein
MFMLRLSWPAVLLLLAFSGTITAQIPRITLEPIVSGLALPVFLTSAHDGSNRRFIVEQAGQIRVLDPGATTPSVFLNISGRVLLGAEQGLLGLAFHPQFRTNRRFYVNYTRRPDGATIVAEYRDGVERILFTVAQPYENHNGGMIEFGPDGYLYVGMGDGGSGNDPQNRAQDPNELLGKILRINVDDASARPEIFASGFRNPWRFSFDRATGLLYAGDVGQNTREEIDIVMHSGNYGWRVWEGTFCTGLGPAPCSSPEFIPPIADYVNTGGNGRCAIIGGYVYRGTQASLPSGSYVYADLCSGEIFLLNDGVQTVLLDTSFQISSLGEDEAGEVYVVGLNGSVYHISNPDVVRASQLLFTTDNDRPFVAVTAGSGITPAVGYARIQATAGQPVPAGVAILALRQNGVVTSETALPASQLIASGRTYAEVDGAVNTSVALANSSLAAVALSFYFTDSSGVNFGAGTTTIPPGGQISAFLNDAPFHGRSNISGTFTFTASAPIAAIALRIVRNEIGEQLLAALPFIEVGSPQPNTTFVPQFVNGGGWKSEILLFNAQDVPISGDVQFFDSSRQLTQTSPYTIAAGASTRLTNLSSDVNMRTGFVRVSGPANAVALLSYARDGRMTTLTAIAAISSSTALALFTEGATIRTGIALVNPAATISANVTLELSATQRTLSIPPAGQVAFFLDELPGFAIPGVLHVRSDVPLSLAGIRIRSNERGEFLMAALAPFDESQNAPVSELVFPHFVEGGGFNMQFVLFGGSTSGTLYLFDQSGTPATLLFP